MEASPGFSGGSWKFSVDKGQNRVIILLCVRKEAGMAKEKRFRISEKRVLILNKGKKKFLNLVFGRTAVILLQALPGPGAVGEVVGTAPVDVRQALPRQAVADVHVDIEVEGRGEHGRQHDEHDPG